MKLVITGILVGVAALSACSSQAEQAAPQVASVQTSQSSTPGPQGQPSTPEKDRPRFRIDMTPEEEARLYDGYRKCMVDHGMPADLGRGRDDGQSGPALPGSGTGQAGRAPGSPGMPPKEVVEAAAKACDGQLPLPAWEHDVNNPEAFDFARRVVACLRAKGVKYVEVSKSTDEGMVGPAFGGPQNDPESISKGLDLTPKCEREVAAGGYK